MCLQLFLLASHRLPTVEDGPDYPELSITAVAAGNRVSEAIQHITPAPFVYAVRPSEHCGCFFCFENRVDFEARMAEVEGTLASAVDRQQEEGYWQHATPALLRQLHKHESTYVAIQEWIWWQGYNSVTALARYLSKHLGDTPIALYVAWENDEGKSLQTRQTIRPSFFGGSSFGQLPVDTLFIIVQENTIPGQRFRAPP